MGIRDKKQSVNNADYNVRPLLTRMDMCAMPVALSPRHGVMLVSTADGGNKDSRVGHVFWGVDESYGGPRIGPTAPCSGAR